MENTPSTSNYAGSGTTDQPMTEQVKEQAGQVMRQTQQAAGQMMDQARTQMKSQITEQKEKAAGDLTSVAQTLRDTGMQMREQQGWVGECTVAAADAVDRFGGYLREKEIEEVICDVENFARRQPAVFLGSAFVLGFMAARFLKSSAQATASQGWADDGSGSRRLYSAYDRAYERGGPAWEGARETAGGRMVYDDAGGSMAGTAAAAGSGTWSGATGGRTMPETGAPSTAAMSGRESNVDYTAATGATTRPLATETDDDMEESGTAYGQTAGVRTGNDT